MGLKFSKQRHKPRISKTQIPWLVRGAIRSNNVETMQYLLTYPNDVDPSMVIDGVCPLNLAIELGHVQMVKILLKAGADVHVADAPRYPLHQACIYGRSEIVDLLLKSEASLATLTERRQSCLHLLANQNADRYIKTAEVLLKRGADPNLLDDDGLSPLHLASVPMAVALCKVISFGCSLQNDVTNLNILSKDGDTPLLTAVKDRKEGVVKVLLEYTKLNLEKTKKNGEHEQSSNDLSDSELCEDGSGDLNCNTLSYRRSNNHHHRTASSKSSTSVGSGRNIISLANAICRGVVGRANSAASIQIHSINHPHNHGSTNSHNQSTGQSHTHSVTGSRTPGNYTFHRGHHSGYKCSQKIGGIEAWGEMPVKRNNHQNSAAGSALKVFGGLKKSRSLLKHNSIINSDATPLMVHNAPQRVPLDIERASKVGMTPLMIAAEAGNAGLAIYAALVGARADLRAVDKMHMTALHYASYVGAIALLRYTFDHTLKTGSRHTLDASPVDLNHFQEVRKAALELLDSQDKYGRTMIYLATGRGHTDVVNYLLSLNANIHITNKEKKSPLYISAYFGHLEITNSLLRHGAKVDQADSHQKTPLYVASYHGRFDIVDLLLAADANVNSCDKNGKTALYIAVLHGHLALARKLISAGALVNHPDHEGLGPLHMAVKFPKLDLPMIKLLLSHGCDPVNLAGFTRWLLAHGIIPDEYIRGDRELAAWLHQEESSVPSLKRLCRQEIQRALGNADHNMKDKLAKLHLPENLLLYISMKAL